MDKNLLGGSTVLMLLSLLSEGDRYGYDIIRELAARSENVFQMREGSLYPVLHRMEAQGWVKAYEKEAENGKKRRYYRITSSGKKQLTAERQQWEEFTGSVEKVIGGDARAFA